MKPLPVIAHDHEPFTLTPGLRLVSSCFHATIGCYDVPVVALRRSRKGTVCKLPDGTVVLYPPHVVLWAESPFHWAKALWNMPRVRAALGGQS